MKQKYKQNGKLKCQDADFTGKLTYHKESVHMKLEQFYCKICKHRSYASNNMKRHMKNMHETSLQFGRIGCYDCENISDFHDCIKCNVKPFGTLKTNRALKCTEENCKFSTNYKQSLKHHIECEHKGILKIK